MPLYRSAESLAQGVSDTLDLPGTYAQLDVAGDLAVGGTKIADVHVPICINAASMLSVSGSPSLGTIATGSTFVPCWGMPGDAASSVAAVISGLPSQCIGVKIEATITTASTVGSDKGMFRIIANPLTDGVTWDLTQWSDNVVLADLGTAHVTDTLRLETFLPVADPTHPVVVRVIREAADPLDTWSGSVSLVAIRAFPVYAPADPEVITAASGYNSWPFVLEVGGNLTVVYSVGVQHGQPDTTRKVVSRSLTGGTWSAEVTILDTAGSDDSAVGKGYDSAGNPLIWTRTTGGVFKLHRTTDGGTSWSVISTPTLGTTPIQITDVINLSSALLSFWHAGTTDGNCAYGVVKSTDDGETWTQTVTASGLNVKDAPVEISGVLIDSTILAIGRCDTGGATSDSGMLQLVSTDDGDTFSKNRTNIFDHYKSTASLIWDGTNVHAYYYRRLWGDLRKRTVDPADILSAPLAWPASELVAVDGNTTVQDSGNCNALAVTGAHKIVWYAGDSSDTAITMATVEV